MKVRIGIKDIFWTYLARFLTFGINIILLPLIMKYLTDDELGLWYVFSSVAQVVNLFDFGFAPAISRHMTYAWSGAHSLKKTSVSDDFDENINSSLVSEVIVTCRFVYFAISAIALAVMATFGTIYVFQIVRNGMTQNIILSWLVYTLAVFFNMFYGYWSSLLQGIGAIAERNKMSVFSKFVQVLVAAIFVPCGLGLLGFVISYFISGMVLRIAGKFYFEKRIREVKIDRKIGKDKVKECFSTILGTAWKDGIVMLSQYFSTQANTLICAYYIDLASTSVYGVMTQVVSVIASVAVSYFNAYQAVFSSACLHRDKEEQKKIVCVTDFVYKLIFIIGVVVLFTVGFPILYLIRPGMQIGVTFSVMLCVFYYFFNQKDLFASMIASFNEVPFWPAYVISAICSVLLSILSVRVFHMGIMGLVAAQLIVNMAYNCWYWPIYMLKRANIRYWEIYTVGFNYIKSKIYQLFTH